MQAFWHLSFSNFYFRKKKLMFKYMLFKVVKLIKKYFFNQVTDYGRDSF